MKRNKAKLVPLVILLGIGVALGDFIHTRPDWTFWQLGKFLLAFIVSLVFGLFANSQILLPILYNLPKSIFYFFTGRLRFAGILWQFVAPASWMLGWFLLGFFAPSIVDFLSSSLGFSLGMALATIAILLALVTPSGLQDLKTDYEEKTFARFGKASHSENVSRLDAFRAAGDTYDKALDIVRPYGALANHRNQIWSLSRDKTLDADAYNEAISVYTDPADFASYTEAELDAHNAAMDNLATAFESLTVTFDALNPSVKMYSKAVKLYKVYCKTFEFEINAYSDAASCALLTALEGNLQASKNSMDGMILGLRAKNPNQTDPVAAKAKADAFNAKADEDGAKVKALEHKATLSEANSKEFLAKAKNALKKAGLDS